MKLHLLTGTALRDLFIQGDISATKIAEYFLHRIAAINPKINAFLSIFESQILQKSAKLDKKRKEGKPLGKMAAIPVAIKDNIHIAGEITTCGSKFLENYKALFDATVVRLLDEEDALFIGKTNLDEFAMGSATEYSAFFPTRNPWNLSCVPGGSSGGSAAAVAARLCPIALGSDTGGSIRQPAAFCGIVGFKPSYGRVSRFGLVAFASSLDQIGPLTTSTLDAALTMEVIGKPCACDSTSLDFPPEHYPLQKSVRGVKFGIPQKLLHSLAPEIKANFLHAVNTFQEMGAIITDVNLDILEYSVAAYSILATAEASTNLARFDGIRYGRRADANTLDELYNKSRSEGFGKEVKRRIMLGTFVLSAGLEKGYYKKAQQIRTLMIQAFEQAFSSCDAILLPTSPNEAFPLNSVHDPLQLYLQDMFTISANLAGLPAISIPSGKTANNLPLGLQIIGPELCDALVMQYAHAFEQKTHHSQVPEIL